jgi:hypothetical protein
MTSIPASRTAASDRRPATSRAVVALVAVLAAVVVGMAGLLASPASAAPLSRVQNGVGVIHMAGGQVVGFHEDIPAGQGRIRAPAYDQTVVGSCVAPETEAGAQILANQAAGNAARDAIAAQYPGAETEVNFDTDLGVRGVDVLTPQGEAIESKVGYTSLTQSVQSQIAKDQWLAENGEVNGVQREFSPSGVTGRVGPSGPLAAALDKAGIPWSIGP